MQARAAIRMLPAEMPGFFREAEEEMAFLIQEPDRWRTSEQPALTETAAGNHTFKWELAPKPLPANRHLFLIELAKRKDFDASKRGAVREFGTGPYAIQEWAEMLTGALRRWRQSAQALPNPCISEFRQTIRLGSAKSLESLPSAPGSCAKTSMS